MRYCVLLILYLASASYADPVSTVELMLRRLVPDSASKFSLQMMATDEKMDVFEFSASKDRATVKGNTGVALASGVYWYLKYHCGCQVTWGFNYTGSNLKMPSRLPDAPLTHMTTPNEFRYSWNVCTFGYTATFWDWNRWEQELDWMALHGINFPLAFVGQEYIWYKTFASYGVTLEELFAFFSGPAFLPWQRMGNMRGWGGPLTMDWMVEQVELQKRILGRARDFGMKPILPCFAGHVPGAIKQVMPHINLTRSPNWWRSEEKYCCDYIVEPTSDVYKTIGKKFLDTLIEEFGTDHYYNCDMYNEMDPPTADPTYLHDSSKSVVEGIKVADSKGVWVMQGWLFHSGFWSYTNTKHYLGGVSDADMIILDLNSETGPLAFKYDNYFGKPWIWNLLHNYGGRRGIYGNLTVVAYNTVADRARAKGTMKGVGFTPEAIEQNPIMYELLTEMGWRSTPPDVDSWVQDYAKQRYGAATPSTKQAWDGLFHTVYDQPSEALSRVNARPSCSFEAKPWNEAMFVNAWKALVKAANHEFNEPNGPMNYDLVDVTSQAIANLWDDVFNMYCWTYAEYTKGTVSRQKALPILTSLMKPMTDMITSLDNLYGSDINYLLGVWLQYAAYKAHNNATLEKQYMFNAKNQVTLWGPRGNINDYAEKDWQGLVGDYYQQRWQMWFKAVHDAVEMNDKLNNTAINDAMLEFGMQWDTSNKTYTAKPHGDTRKIAAALVFDYTTMPSNYKVVKDVDAPGNDIVDPAAWTHDPAQLAILCNMNPNCKGFNTDGWLKSKVDDHIKLPGVDVYVKTA